MKLTKRNLIGMIGQIDLDIKAVDDLANQFNGMDETGLHRYCQDNKHMVYSGLDICIKAQEVSILLRAVKKSLQLDYKNLAPTEKNSCGRSGHCECPDISL